MKILNVHKNRLCPFCLEPVTGVFTGDKTATGIAEGDYFVCSDCGRVGRFTDDLSVRPSIREELLEQKRKYPEDFWHLVSMTEKIRLLIHLRNESKG
jgi:hypothetical protein